MNFATIKNNVKNNQKEYLQFDEEYEPEEIITN